jgi:hypothetical protein
MTLARDFSEWPSRAATTASGERRDPAMHAPRLRSPAWSHPTHPQRRFSRCMPLVRDFSERPSRAATITSGERRGSRRPSPAATFAGTVAPSPPAAPFLTLHDIGAGFFGTALACGHQHLRRTPTDSVSRPCRQLSLCNGASLPTQISVKYALLRHGYGHQARIAPPRNRVRLLARRVVVRLVLVESAPGWA